MYCFLCTHSIQWKLYLYCTVPQVYCKRKKTKYLFSSDKLEKNQMKIMRLVILVFLMLFSVDVLNQLLCFILKCDKLICHLMLSTLLLGFHELQWYCCKKNIQKYCFGVNFNQFYFYNRLLIKVRKNVNFLFSKSENWTQFKKLF